MDSRVRKLVVWYRRWGRKLPWRETDDAYRIFVSELMLQQTQVDRAIPLYQAFIKRFPHWKSLAIAPTADVIRAWKGLGYNRRALYAREAAIEVVTRGVPVSEKEWRKFKGVGPYMAAALTEFVNHVRAIVIDTNVRRVAGRVFLGKPYPDLKDDRRLLRILDQMIPRTGRHWDVPQAFMDLANTICRPQSPQCEICPLRIECRSAKMFLSRAVAKKPVRAVRERIHRDKPFPDRIYRGRILGRIMQHGKASIARLGPLIDPDYDEIQDAGWVRAMAERLVADGLLGWKYEGVLDLP